MIDLTINYTYTCARARTRTHRSCVLIFLITYTQKLSRTMGGHPPVLTVTFR